MHNILFGKDDDDKPKGLGEEFQYHKAKGIDDTITTIINVIEDSAKIGELYKKINPQPSVDNLDEEIPF